MATVLKRIVSRNRTRRLAVVFVILMAVMFAIGGAEIYVRLRSPFGYVTPELLRSRSPQYSSALFARHVFPQEEQRIVNAQGELKYYINSLGYRGAPFIPHKQSGTIRIIVYGGSSVFDPANFGRGDWPHRVEDRLRQSGLAGVEIINAGIPGHASFDCLGRLFAEGHLFSPTYVLYYGAWNDIKNFTSTQPLLRQYISGLYTSDPRTTYRNRADYWLCRASQLYVRLRERYYVWKYNIQEEGGLPKGNYRAGISKTALRQYRMDIQTIVDAARNAGATPVLITEGRLVARDNTDDEKKRISYSYVLLTHEALNDAFEATDRILKEISEEKHVTLIDASSRLSGKSEFFVDEVHLTERGSNALADIVAHSMALLLMSAGSDSSVPQPEK